MKNIAGKGGRITVDLTYSSGRSKVLFEVGLSFCVLQGWGWFLSVAVTMPKQQDPQSNSLFYYYITDLEMLKIKTD